MDRRFLSTSRLASACVVLALGIAGLLPGRVSAGTYGNVSVTGTGTTVTGGTTFVNGAGSTQVNVGSAQSAGPGTAYGSAGACPSSPLGPAQPGSTSTGTVFGGTSSFGGTASSGTATGAVVSAGNAVGGNAVGGNAVGGNVQGANAVGGATAPGKAKGSPAVGASASGGSAIGGSAVGGGASTCVTTPGTRSSLPANGTGARALICGTLLGYNAGVLTISTVSGRVDLTISANAILTGTLTRDANACMLLTRIDGQIVAVTVLPCHGSTNGVVDVSPLPIAANAALVGGNACGQESVHSTTQVIAAGTTPSTTIVSVDCPDPCSPSDPHLSSQSLSALPSPSTTPTVSPTVSVPAHSQTDEGPGTHVLTNPSLQLKDLPSGFQQIEASNPTVAHVAQYPASLLPFVQGSGHVADFQSAFAQSASLGVLAIGDRVDVFRSSSSAHRAFAAMNRGISRISDAHGLHRYSSTGIGQERIEFMDTPRTQSVPASTLHLLFRRGHSIATVTISGDPKLVTSRQIRELGHLLDARIRTSP